MSRIEEIKKRLDKAPEYDKGMFRTIEGMEFLWSAKSDIEYLLDTLAYEKSATAEAIRRISELETTLRHYDRGERTREVFGEHDGGL